MAGQVSTLRRKLRSIKSTQKITNAMALVATAKLQKQKGRMYENNEYADTYHRILLSALSAEYEGEETSPFLVTPKCDNPLHIIVTSNSGLCGSYNMDLLKFVRDNIDKDDPIFAIGTYGIKWLDANDYMVVKRFDSLDSDEHFGLNSIIYDILELYKMGEISSIDVIYTQYVNTMTFSPAIYEILPLDIPEGLEKKEIELAPDRNSLFDHLIPQYVSAVVFSTFLEAKTSEHAARRSAMDNANKNAQALIDEISLSYNQARQAGITQEVTEITAGADAL